MTLTKAIEAAREALQKCSAVMKGAEELIASLGLHDKWHEEGKPHSAFHELFFKRSRAEEALAALPDKPMTEEEILALVVAECNAARCNSKRIIGNRELGQSILKALKAAKVLYVEGK